MNGSRKVISITVILVLAQTFLSPFGPLGMSGLNSSSYGVENILSVATDVACSPFLERPCIEVFVSLLIESLEPRSGSRHHHLRALIAKSAKGPRDRIRLRSTCPVTC
jgi:hypothetical protein